MMRSSPFVAAAALAALCACSIPAVTPEGPTEDALFPHVEGFGEGGQHGQEYLGERADSCVRCHDLDAGPEEDGVESGADGCRSCHTDYPHAPEWLVGHGVSWFDLDRQATCGPCHGEDLAGGASAVACDSCHAAWPHAQGWEDSSEHGGFLASRGTLDSCLGCHPSEPADDGADMPGCGDCHAGYPHGEDWSSGELHGAGWLEGDCGTCHGVVGEGGAWAPTCATCHSAYPHGADWLPSHPASVPPTGEETCLICHDAGDGPQEPPTSCAATCHGVAP